MSFMQIRDLIRAKLKREERFESWRDITVAKVTAVEGSIQPTEPGYLWVNLWGDEGSPAKAFNSGFTLAAGDWVKVGVNPKDPFRWSILEYWAGDIEPEYMGRIARHEVGLHGLNHQIPTEATAGADPVKAYQPAMQQLKTTGNGTDLTITVQPLIYHYGGARKNYLGGTIDLTGHTPVVGDIRAVLIYLNMITNVAGTIDGTSVPVGGAYPIQYPTPLPGWKFSAYVILINGQTTIVTADDIEDARDFLAGDTDFLPTPTTEGQVLMSDESLQAIWATPVISDDGSWMTGDDDQLVWE